MINTMSATTLCLEIGHTRTKAVHLPSKIESIETLKGLQIVTALSAPYLQQNLETLFQRGSPLESLLNEKAGKIALSIFGPLYENRFHGCAAMYQVPQNIKEALEAKTPYQFSIEGDAVSWAIGALRYLALKGQTVAFPCLAVTLGTHPGVAFIENPERITSLEFWPNYHEFSHLSSVTEIKPPEHVLSKSYLDSRNGEEGLQEEMIAYRPTFNCHFQAFTDDLGELINRLFSKQIACVLVGGGNSRFIDRTPQRIVLNPESLAEDQISPDIIPLLGCQKKMEDPRINTGTYPPYETLCKLFNAPV
jgi:hypothetical protein